MCVAVPARVEEITGNTALVSALGYRESVDIRLVPGVKTGDFVLVHVGFAINRIDAVEAMELFSLWRE